ARRRDQLEPERAERERAMQRYREVAGLGATALADQRERGRSRDQLAVPCWPDAIRRRHEAHVAPPPRVAPDRRAREMHAFAPRRRGDLSSWTSRHALTVARVATRASWSAADL